jgi:hypothetical protein
VPTHTTQKEIDCLIGRENAKVTMLEVMPSNNIVSLVVSKQLNE